MNLLHPRIYLSLAALSLLLIIPFSAGSNFVFHLFILICSYAALASAWNIVGGVAGQLSLGHAVFYGTGAYVSTLLLLHLNLSPWLGMLLGAAVSTALAVLISWPCFRLRGPFFALATIAVLEVVRLLVINQHDLTGGAAGLAVPLKLGAEWMLFRARWPYLLIAFGFLAITLLVSWKIKHSRLGYYLIAVREREDAAQAVGVNAVKVKLIAVALSAALTSLIGSFHAMYLTFIEPGAMFSLELSIQIAMFALIGGLGTLSGPLIGTVIVLPLAELARGWLGDAGSGVHGLVYGLVLVAFVLTIPQGLVGRFGQRVSAWVDRLPGASPTTLPPAPTRQERQPSKRVGQPILVAENLHKFFGGLHATNDVSLTLNEGEIVGVIGPNGAGKTTVFNQLSGFIQPSSGLVKVRTADDQWVTPSSPAQFAVAGIGRTFQIVQPFADLSVCENIMLGAFMHTRNPAEARQIAAEVAALTDLGPLLDSRARNLTVGGMKRLEMARALATRPRVLLLDEVMAGLNPTDVAKAIEIIRRVRDTGVSVLMIEHIMQATMTLSDRIVVISTGAVLMEGEPQVVVSNPQVIEAYLGKEYDHAAA
ncbi:MULTISPECIES: branched-chain amino acid ABC transporter ATP-binding protein/permease [Pseudomonas]|jgi:branched-chain amino acid transport system permease protein|uniref:branched-chain amino acid ABC transporter ATP-binding protein/permease n=1 Tax=Pseudomonas TaxID=286 RepID=UPI0018D6CCBD|nr:MULTISPECIES: branched-chain amino acid ABC transporter ATP-binding protein/permease [Pseudomonas]MBH3371723.1 branched-chain amino acid ABC transporter ATP-binding protein/permease [Pseudomonas juntendi]MBS6036151.1 branched-chain amino acid ABC transporter ATP-binding protein/permease [Pseudomonas sp.]WHL27261.1 branched-chain amino acid ABC transporter ATP-binding protein/permease [Pseudomonas juntendi]CAH0648384.1 Vitamin B12 import ATP-binding protein BtuD [Pseudomonas sp. Nvir]